VLQPEQTRRHLVIKKINDCAGDEDVRTRIYVLGDRIRG